VLSKAMQGPTATSDPLAENRPGFRRSGMWIGNLSSSRAESAVGGGTAECHDRVGRKNGSKIHDALRTALKPGD